MLPHPLTRRQFLGVCGMLAAPGACSLSVRADSRENETIKVGILHSLTGVVADVESKLNDAEELAIAEINQAGGLLGKKIELIVEDGESRFGDVFPEKAEKLLVKDKVVAVFGCWTSVSRHFVRPAFEKSNGLLF